MRILHLNWSKLRVSLIIKIVSFISCVIGLSWSKLRVARFYFLTQWIKFREVSRFIFLSLSNTVGTSERAELRSIMLLHFQCDSHWKPLKGLTRHAEVITFLLDSSANVACYSTSHLFWQVFCTRVMLMSSWGCVWFLQLKISLCKQTLKVYKTQKKGPRREPPSSLENLKGSPYISPGHWYFLLLYPHWEHPRLSGWDVHDSDARVLVPIAPVCWLAVDDISGSVQLVSLPWLQSSGSPLVFPHTGSGLVTCALLQMLSTTCNILV